MERDCSGVRSAAVQEPGIGRLDDDPLAQLEQAGSPPRLDFTCFGVGIALAVEVPALVAPIKAVLPPLASPGIREPAAARLTVRSDPGERGLVSIARPGGTLGSALDPEVAVRLLEERLPAIVAQRAEGWAFVHAGVVVVGERAIILPGRSLSGRSIIVEALAREGAHPWSETYAVLDSLGNLHPFGGSAGAGATASIALVATAPYRPGAHWSPERGGAAAAALAMLETAATQGDRGWLLAVLGSAAARATALRGERGEATEIAPQLLAELGC
jgi:hypothetical protein